MKKLILLAVWATLVSGCAATAVTAPVGVDLGVWGDARQVTREVM